MNKLTIGCLLLSLATNAFGYYMPGQGRWLNRDPLHEDGGHNLFGFVQNNSVNYVDPKGLWGYDVHYGWTRAWSVVTGYKTTAAIMVAEADNAVDYGGTSPIPVTGDQRYHFNRAIYGGVDTRIERKTFHFSEAKKWCDWLSYGDVIGDVPDYAALNLGTALHPWQDIVAHGDFGVTTIGFAPWHNWSSNQHVNFGSVTDLPDNFELDASNGPNGVPTGAGITLDPITGGMAWFIPGSKRRQLTESMTKSVLQEFLNHVRARSKPCGKCRDLFLQSP